MGDPGRNLCNTAFWGWHGPLEQSFQRYLKFYATDAERSEYAKTQDEEGRRMDASTDDASAS